MLCMSITTNNGITRLHPNILFSSQWAINVFSWGCKYTVCVVCFSANQLPQYGFREFIKCSETHLRCQFDNTTWSLSSLPPHDPFFKHLNRWKWMFFVTYYCRVTKYSKWFKTCSAINSLGLTNPYAKYKGKILLNLKQFSKALRISF